MDKKEIFEKVIEICKEVFENEDVVLTDASTASDVEGWDSITHLNLISDLEDEFGIAFTLEEITKSKALGDLVDALMKHLEEK